jgi:hypothetical protein
MLVSFTMPDLVVDRNGAILLRDKNRDPATVA